MWTRIAPRAFARYNSSSAASSRSTTRLATLASAVEKPHALEASVPVLWAVCGALTCVAWSRMEGRKGDEVEKLIIV